MPGAVVRSISKTASNGLYPVARRSVHRLSDGNLAAVIMDNNSNAVAGDGGDSTNIAKIYIYTSATGEVWTLRATVTTDVSGIQGLDYSSCIDALNNIHLIWRTANSSVSYVKVTYGAGPTFTPGTIRSVWATASGFTAGRVDIDSLGNSTDDVVMVAYTHSTTQSSIRTFHTNGGGATIHTTIAILLGGTPKSDTDYVTIQGCKDAIVANVATFALLANQAYAKDLGERLNILQINTSTGAQIAIAPTYTLPDAGKAAGLRQFTMICPDTQPRTFYVTGVFADGSTTTGGTMAAWKFTVNSGVTRTDVVPFHTKQMPNGSHSAGISAGWQFANAAFDGTDQMLLFFTTLNFAYTCMVDFSTGIGVWRTIPYTFDSLGYPVTGGSISTVSAGGSRNLTVGTIGCLVFYGKAMYQVRYLGIQIPPIPVNISPYGGQTVDTDRPVFSAQFKEVYNSPQVNRKIKWQVASDSGFTTNFREILDDVSQRPLNTATGGAIITVQQECGAAQEMFQGLWYIRSYEIDELGNLSPASTPGTFTISHPPNGINLAPNGGAVAKYGLGSLQVQWTFTDPSPFDFQTAYELFVFDVDGNTIFDSGKLVSTNQTGVLTIPSGNKDQILRWGVKLWDSDDVSGPMSPLQSFIVSDAPAPVFTNPLDGAVLAALPNITWTPTIAGVKSQQSWRLVIKQASTVIVDTGYVADSTTASYQIPTGLLHNLNAYTFTVYVVDNLGLEGIATISVTTSWTAPAAPLTNVYLYEFDRRGFVFVGWNNALVDANFIQWNVYRRAVGDLTWETLAVINEYMPTYGYRDYSAKANTTYQYVVTQVSNATGDLVESSTVNYIQVVTPASQYWMLDPFGILDAVPLFSVTADSYADETESAVFNLYGRGRHRDIGDYLGPNGSLTIQMRDKFIGLDTAENLFYDPAFQMHTVGYTPDKWTIASTGSVGNVSNGYQTFFEPMPNGKLQNLVVRADAFTVGAGNYISISQTLDAVRLVGIYAQARKFRTGWWFAPESDPANGGTTSYLSHVEYYNAANALISSEDIALTQVDTYEPAVSGDLNVGNSKRYTAQHTMPLLTDHMIVTVRITNSTAAANGVIIGGASVFAGTTDKAYFDGDFNGAIWNAGQYISTSVSQGTYSARNQRLDIYSMRNSGRSALVRNPFGDVWNVSFDDPKFDRMAGTGGEAEFGDIQMPYVTVAT